MIKTVNIEGVERKMASSAILVRQYRAHFGRDLIVDMTKATKARKPGEELRLEDIDISVFENLAWLMLKNAGEDVGDSPEAWLETLESPFTVYELIGDISDLWTANLKTTAVPKKK